MMIKNAGTFLSILLIPLVALGQWQAQDIEGVWLREDKRNYKIEIYRCQKAYCGRIIWLQEEFDDQGNARKDRNNPDPKLRDRPLLGMDVLTGFVFKDNEWKEGNVYSFNRGKSYDARIRREGEVLKMTVSILFLSRTYNWVKTEP